MSFTVSHCAVTANIVADVLVWLAGGVRWDTLELESSKNAIDNNSKILSCSCYTSDVQLSLLISE